TREEDGAYFRDQYVAWIREVLSHLLLDCAALLFPVGCRVVNALHSQRFYMQRHVEIFSGHSEQILRQALTRIGVEISAHHAADVSQLLGCQSRAAAEHHV